MIQLAHRLIFKALCPDTVRTGEFQSVKHHSGQSRKSVSKHNPYLPSLYPFHGECTFYVPSGILIPNTAHQHPT